MKNSRIIEVVAAIVLMLSFLTFKHFNNFENTILLISSLVLVELFLLNNKN